MYLYMCTCVIVYLRVYVCVHMCDFKILLCLLSELDIRIWF